MCRIFRQLNNLFFSPALFLALEPMNKSPSKLFLIPNILADENTANFFAPLIKNEIHHLKHFIVENEKAARALIKKMELATPQNELTILLWNEHSKKEDLPETVTAIKDNDVGIISEAGLPCIADPGADIVKWAHTQGIRVVPLPGASSIFMALMASGFSGQSFTFHGYLPIDKPQRAKKLKEMEADALRKHQSQIFMEAPYRNNQLLEDIIKNCAPTTNLCIAMNITAGNEFIQTKALQQWGKQLPELHKKPVIFVMG
jgi:16S rRNA (cytidine1402-2'-O)-methyltransferase